MVVAIDPAASRARVLAGRPAAGADPAASRALAAELAAAVDAPKMVVARSKPDLALLARVGAIDLPGRGAVAYVVLPVNADSATTVDSLVEALATTASRAA